MSASTEYPFARARFRLVALLAAALPAALVGCGPTSFVVTPVSASKDLRESVLKRESLFAVKKIALIDVDGMLQNTRERPLVGPAGENPVSLFAEMLDRAASDRHVGAVVLRLNTPGGTVTASELMYTELQRFRQRTGKPVVACMLDVAASGGYYLACATDHIVAHPTTVTGSIGVVMLTPDFSGTMYKIGLDVNVIKSGRMKDAGSPFREMAPEDRAMFQKLVDTMYAQFLAVVERGRPNVSPERIKELADGRVFLGPEAQQLGLVDRVGTLHDAIAIARELAGLSDMRIKLVRYVRPLTHRPNIYAYQNQPQINVLNVVLPDWLTGPAPRMMYLWAPGWQE